MPDFTLLTLRLHAPIPYEGIENPPFAGLPSPAEARDLSPGHEKSGRPAGKAGLEDGEEELFVFDESGLVAFDPDDGPRVSLPLPPPSFYGRAVQAKRPGREAGNKPPESAGAVGGAEAASLENAGAALPEGAGSADTEGALAPPRESAMAAPRGEYALRPGAYLFMQFRPIDEEELRGGLEWFARESWWEGAEARGPYVVRRVAEDGKLATQVLRAI